MGWSDFWEDAEDDVKEVGKDFDDSFRRGFSSLDDKLNLSENKGAALGTALFGSVGGMFGSFHDKAAEARDKANEAARSANEARLAAQRTTNFRSLYQMVGQTQQNAAELMNIAASGGFMDSSAIRHSVSAAESQVQSSGKYFSTQDSLGAVEASAMDTMRSEEQRMQKYNMYFNAGINMAGNAASALIFG